MIVHFLLLSVLVCGKLGLAETDPEVQVARTYRQAHELDIVKDFMSLLAVPNVAADPPNLRKNAEAILALLNKHGIKSRFLEHEGPPPVVYGELPIAGLHAQ